MVNQYASWKYILLVLIVALGLVYAAPNLYGEDPALQNNRLALLDQLLQSFRQVADLSRIQS